MYTKILLAVAITMFTRLMHKPRDVVVTQAPAFRAARA